MVARWAMYARPAREAVQGVVDAHAFACVCRDGGQAGRLPRLPVFAFGLQVAVQGFFAGG